MRWPDLLWGRVTLAIATVALAVAGSIEQTQRPWTIFGPAGFIILHAFVNWLRERRLASRLGRNYEEIQRRVLRLIADLSVFTGHAFDLWMVDLYLPRWSLLVLSRGSLSFAKPKKRFVRELSLALTDVRTVPLEIEMSHGLFGLCFAQPQPRLWWDRSLAQTHTEANNFWDELDHSVNVKLKETYGVISVNPVADSLGRDCLGLLVVHTKRDSEVATKALGVLAESGGMRGLAEACHDIHGRLARQ